VLENNHVLLNNAYKVNEVASDSGDEGTIAMISEIISALEKRIWMLESTVA
jgi:starvation-inducible DNA-binding protein